MVRYDPLQCEIRDTTPVDSFPSVAMMQQHFLHIQFQLQWQFQLFLAVLWFTP